MAQASTERQLRSVRPLHRHKGLIALTTVAVVLSALFASLVQQKVYRATAVVDVHPPLTVPGEAGLLRSGAVRSAVAARGGTPGAVTVKTDGGNQIEVTAQSASAKNAAALANGYVRVYVDQRRNDLTAGPAGDMRAGIGDLQRQIDTLTVEISQARPAAAGPLVTRRDSLVRQQADLRRQLDQLSSRQLPELRVIPARAPGAPIRPHPLRNSLLALVVGLAFGLLLALSLELLDRRAHAPRKERPAGPPLVPAAAQTRTAPPPPPAAPPAAAAPEPPPAPAPAEAEPEPRPQPEEEPAVERSGPGVPVLGMIPAVATWRGRETPLLRRDQPTTPSAEAYRGLAATVQRILPHRPLRSIVVTSPAQRDGKTTVSANLGLVLARAGKSVVVVDCDLRHPSLHDLFGLPNEAGFTSVLRGEAPLSRAVQNIAGEPRLQLLASGPPPTAPGQLLSAQRTMEVLTALQAQADVLVIDVPAVEPTGDAAVVASIVDAALVIAGAPSGQAADLARAVDLLDGIEGLVVGVVLNAVEDPDTDGRVAMLRQNQPRVSLA
jgi:capsular exopolysaccharide synthesis family protein